MAGSHLFRVEDGAASLDDPDYWYVGPGPMDDCDGFTSTSNVEF